LLFCYVCSVLSDRILKWSKKDGSYKLCGAFLTQSKEVELFRGGICYGINNDNNAIGITN